MHRWHSGKERNLMLRRWRQEIAEHEGWFSTFGGRTPPPNGHYPWGRWSFAPLPPTVCDDSCHCYRGPGFFRKNRPFGCSCWMCKWDKHREKWGRANRRRAAIAIAAVAALTVAPVANAWHITWAPLSQVYGWTAPGGLGQYGLQIGGSVRML